MDDTEQPTLYVSLRRHYSLTHLVCQYWLLYCCINLTHKHQLYIARCHRAKQ